MDKHSFQTYRIDDRSYQAFIKREIHNLVAQAGFGSQRAGEIDIIISELCSNLIKHANGGELIYRLLDHGDGNKSFEVYCIDNGEGTNDMARYLKDGVSSVNTLGHGLGSIKRLSDVFQIYSMPQWGTIVYSKVMLPLEDQEFVRKEKRFDYRVIQTCFQGEKVSGDGYCVVETDEETRIFVGDGLGHGAFAYDAVQAAIAAFRTCGASDPVDIIRTIHQQVKKTRGLVAVIAILNHSTKQWRICGVGNISVRLYQGLESKNYMSHNGIIGLNVPNTLKAFETAKTEYQWIVFCSDGIRSRWDISRYTSVLKYDPAIMAAAIFKDHARRTDDMLVLAAKIK